MRIIISPAKKMREDTDSLAPSGLPDFLPETQRLLDALGLQRRHCRAEPTAPGTDGPGAESDAGAALL